MSHLPSVERANEDTMAQIQREELQGISETKIDPELAAVAASLAEAVLDLSEGTELDHEVGDYILKSKQNTGMGNTSLMFERRDGSEALSIVYFFENGEMEIATAVEAKLDRKELEPEIN